jgi:phospholipase C
VGPMVHLGATRLYWAANKSWHQLSDRVAQYNLSQSSTSLNVRRLRVARKRRREAKLRTPCVLAIAALIAFLGGCRGLVSDPTPTPTPTPTPIPGPPPPSAGTITKINHIIFLAQENRSFDHYFGELRRYWADNGYPDQPFNGLPQFNPTPGATPSNPACDPNGTSGSPFTDCSIDAQSAQIESFHLLTECVENPSPFWNEAHYGLSWSNPLISFTPTDPPPLDGFVAAAAHDSIALGYTDTAGKRVMGYYDGGNPNDPSDPGDLNYYYFMASKFATSDSWFAPVLSRTQPNREYLIAGTSQGYVYPVGTDSQNGNPLTAKTIFQELQSAGVSWKIYTHPNPTAFSANGVDCAANSTTPQCLLFESYVQNFTWGLTIPTNYPSNLVSDQQFFTDLQSGTLPQVAQIEPPTDVGLDEHPSDLDTQPQDIQPGAAYVASLINALMASQYWKDSVFILTYDEPGGFYDHVPPQPAVSPDGIAPVDLQPGDVCTQGTGPTCDFVFTGYRVPLLVISPFTRKNYVSHTVADTTAILKLIETRFGLPNLTHRDAAQPDMSEFFDFTNVPWSIPPTPPAQNTSGQCYLDHLP